MTYTVFSKDRKSLQFPVMCDGYITIPRDSGTAPNQEIGLWALSGGFSFEAIVTPYDVNGNPDGFSATQKSLSRGTKGLNYIGASDRKDMSLTLFHNTNFTIQLKNKETSSNPTLPAEYSIFVTMTIGGVTSTLESSTIITATPLDDSSHDPNAYLYSLHDPFAKLSARQVTTHNGSTTITLDGVPEFGAGYIAYNESGESLGTVTSVSSNTITTDGYTATPSTIMYYSLPKEPVYAVTPHHIAFSYSTDGLMQIFYNGTKLTTTIHTAGGNFSFDTSDCYIGQTPDASTYAERRKSQFMGELHELSIMSVGKTQFRSTNTLYPLFKDTLLYMDFEEENLNG